MIYGLDGIGYRHGVCSSESFLWKTTYSFPVIDALGLGRLGVDLPFNIRFVHSLFRLLCLSLQFLRP